MEIGQWFRVIFCTVYSTASEETKRRSKNQLLCTLLRTNKLSLGVGTARGATISSPKKIDTRPRDGDQCAECHGYEATRADNFRGVINKAYEFAFQAHPTSFAK